MVRRTRGLVVGILALGAAADAQPRPAPPPSVVVLRVVQAPVLDARATYEINTHWMAAAGMENFGDEDYFLFHPFPRRTTTAELKYKF